MKPWWTVVFVVFMCVGCDSTTDDSDQCDRECRITCHNPPSNCWGEAPCDDGLCLCDDVARECNDESCADYCSYLFPSNEFVGCWGEATQECLCPTTQDSADLLCQGT